MVLECLALRVNSLVTADFLIEVLWNGRQPAHPGPQLQVYASNLRKILEPDRPKGVAPELLTSRPGGYSLMLEDTQLDLLQFWALVSSGRRYVQDGELAAGKTSLRQAIELFRGQVLPDLADVDLLRPELNQLEEARLDAYEDLVDVELVLGTQNGLVGELQLLVSQYPFRERLSAGLVLALYRADRQVEALAACRSASNALRQELGIEPCPRLKELETLVLRQDASLKAPPTR